MIKLPQYIFLFLLCIQPMHSMADDITIGVRAHNGEEHAIQRWSPTIRYLQKHIPEHKFHLRPIARIEDMAALVSAQQLDFVLTQPVAYVDLERLFGVTRILTLEKKGGTTSFGSVIITRSDRADILTLDKVRGKSIAGVTKKGFGGWLIGYEELQNHGINSHKAFNRVVYLGTQNNVVKSVLKGETDVGIVRTGIIEKMSSTGDIDITKLRVLNQQTIKNFPFRLSTRLYPEWAFAKTNKVTPDIAKKVALTLLSLPKDGEVAIKGEYSQWDIPLNYNSVHALMKRQKVGSYSTFGNVGILQFLNQHTYESILLLFLIIALFVSLIYMLRSNKLLKKEKFKTEQAINEIEILRGIIPICSYCYSIRNDEGSWGQMEAYISKHSEASFSHGICPRCLTKARADAGLIDNNN